MSQQEPLISIIIPVYNRIAYVFEAIDSALNQTYPNIEVMVVDDGSTDGTYEQLEASHRPIVLLQQPENRGQAAARNRGLFSCSGEYVLFLDSDDVLEPHALETLWGELSRRQEKDSTWGLSYGKKLTCDSDLRPAKAKSKTYYDGNILPHLFFDNFVRTGSYLARKSIIQEIGGYREDLRVKEDLLLHFTLAVHYKFAFTGQFLSKYRRHVNHRARHNYDKIIEQDMRHLDYFFEEHPRLDPAIEGVKDLIYAKEHLELCKIAWRSRLPEIYLYHWKSACALHPNFRWHPKFLSRALWAHVKLS